MGMSASQARFLGLTSRKSNVEFQGQQVNQQRTSLANESAGLFNQMLALQVPTPPSAVDFYSMSYTFAGETPNETYQILSWAASTTPTVGAYDIEVKKTINDIGLKQGTLPVGTTLSTSEANVDSEGKPIYTIRIPATNGGTIEYQLKASNKDVNGKNAGDEGYIPSYSYQKGGKTYFISNELLASMFASDSPFGVTTDANGVKTATITSANQDTAIESYYKGDKTVEHVTLTGVTMAVDDTGRFTGMTYSPDGNPENMKEVSLTIEEIHDDKGYEEAMQDYNYKKMMYDRTIEDINTRTEIIQKQDQNLELNLKQLDTEQEALQQELDAVKKVIDKNVETTFKTFA